MIPRVQLERLLEPPLDSILDALGSIYSVDIFDFDFERWAPIGILATI